jgi:ABC-type Co2+ transport system permease subunit
MSVRLRRLAPGELDHEMIWLCVTVSAALFTLLWLRFGLPWPRCTFHAVVGLPCLTCGSTRAALAVAHGEIAQAWHHNPLATLALGALTVFDAYAFVVLVSRAPRLRVGFSSAASRRASLALLLCAALLNWLYLIRHGS